MAANATSPQVNRVGVSGGGSGDATASDSTVIGANAPALSLAKSHIGNFIQGQRGATYTLVISNDASAAATSGTVTVTETVPSGLTLAGLAGVGWSCTSNTCSRPDALAPGASYPAITAAVNVAANAVSPQVNRASVSGGGSATANAADTTVIMAAPSLSLTMSHSGYFVQGQQKAAYSIVVSNAAGAGTTSGTVTVTDTIPAGLALVSMSGAGWSCSSNQCTRGGTLAGGASYPAITVTVNVAPNAASPQLNQAAVTGGGADAASITDSTIVKSPPSLSIDKSHSGNFLQGQKGATYSLVISNASNATSTSGTVTVTETMPAGLSLVSMSGSGWTCSSTVCTRNDALAGGASYPLITVTVNVTAAAATPQINKASVSGGGSVSATATDSTNIVKVSQPSLTITKTHTDNFTQGRQAATYILSVSNFAGAGATSGTVTVTEVMPSGLTLVSMSGSGWSCSSNTCTRGDSLVGGASYPAITVTVNVAANAASPQVNQASVSGGGSPSSTVRDSTIINAVNQPTLSVSAKALNFGESGSLVTGSQIVLVSFDDGLNVAWTASSNQANISVSPSSGIGNGAFEVSVTGSGSGIVTIAAADAANSPLQIQINAASVAPALPYGSFDTPLDGAGDVTGSVPVTCWALDNIEVMKVDIWRDPVGSEPKGGLVYIGDAIFVEGARPDIEASYPAAPMNHRAGWGYLMLTNFLPNSDGSSGLGNGTYKLRAIAYNAAGKSIELGTKTITCDNAHATKPFGAIDTPGQGATISGSAGVNYGWALTPNPNNIPVDGSTIVVYLDGQPLGHPIYNNYRSDIATLFPGYNNSGGAVGYYLLDTTTLANGVHNMAWSVTDNTGRADGIGSRYFNVLNTQHAALPTPAAIAPARRRGIRLSEGYELRRKRIALAAQNGTYSVRTRELGRIELQLGAEAGYSLVDGEKRPLPIGSSLKDGVFYWQPGPGFLGEYRLAFEPAGERDSPPIRVDVTIEPKTW